MVSVPDAVSIKAVQYMKNRLMAAVVFALLILLSGCGTPLNDAPPWPDTPEPSPLNGAYDCGQGTFTFSGDGKTVISDLSGEAEKIIPDGEYEYLFLWNTGGEVRYDIASDFRLLRDDDHWDFGVYGANENRFTISYYLSSAAPYDGVELTLTFDRAAETDPAQKEGQ